MDDLHWAIVQTLSGWTIVRADLAENHEAFTLTLRLQQMSMRQTVILRFPSVLMSVDDEEPPAP